MQKPSSIAQTFAMPADAATCYSRGVALADMGRYLEALIHFEQVLDLQPINEKALVFRGVVLIHLGRDQEALASCEAALQVNPYSTEAWMFRGVALQRLNQYQAAYRSYDRALGVQQRSPWDTLQSWLKGLARWLSCRSLNRNGAKIR
jgi:tetratricopeptide (TPR) repeat protein